MTDAAVYDEVHKNLQALRNFLMNNETALRAAIDSLAVVVPQVRHLTGNLVTVMEQFRSTLEGVREITYNDIELLAEFASHLHSFLSSNNPLLPEEPEHRKDLVDSTNLLSGLNSLAQKREELVQITEDIIFQVRGLRPDEQTPAATWVN